MAVSEYDEKERLYSPDGPDEDAETGSNGEDLPHPPYRRRWGFTQTPISYSLYLALFGTSILGAFFAGARLTNKASQINIAGAYCK